MESDTDPYKPKGVGFVGKKLYIYSISNKDYNSKSLPFSAFLVI